MLLSQCCRAVAPRSLVPLAAAAHHPANLPRPSLAASRVVSGPQLLAPRSPQLAAVRVQLWSSAAAPAAALSAVAPIPSQVALAPPITPSLLTKLPLYRLEAGRFEVDGDIEVLSDLVSAPLRMDLLQLVVRWQLAKRRQGTAMGKTRAEVSGGGRKPWRQKGTGRARAGSRRSPLWRHGGKAHPPRPRSYEFKLNTKVRRLALRVALSIKHREGKLIVCHGFPSLSKTKEAAQMMALTAWSSALFIDGPVANAAFALATRNVWNVDHLAQAGLNVYDVLRRDVLVLNKDCLGYVEDRLLGVSAQLIREPEGGEQEQAAELD